MVVDNLFSITYAEISSTNVLNESSLRGAERRSPANGGLWLPFPPRADPYGQSPAMTGNYLYMSLIHAQKTIIGV